MSSISLDQSQSAPWMLYVQGANQWVRPPSFAHNTLDTLSGELVYARRLRLLGHVQHPTDRGALSKTNTGHRKDDHTVDNAASHERHARTATGMNTYMLWGACQ